MNILRYLKLQYVLIVLMVFITACKSPSVNRQQLEHAGIKNLIVIDESTYVSGTPTQQQIYQLSKAGIKNIISLQPAKELAWDEADFIKQSGMNFTALPVDGAAGVTVENAKRLDNLLQKFEGEPTLVHCGSGNRVGALIALHAIENEGMSLEEAIAKGKKWGLTRLETKLRNDYQ